MITINGQQFQRGEDLLNSYGEGLQASTLFDKEQRQAFFIGALLSEYQQLYDAAEAEQAYGQVKNVFDNSPAPDVNFEDLHGRKDFNLLPTDTPMPTEEQKATIIKIMLNRELNYHDELKDLGYSKQVIALIGSYWKVGSLPWEKIFAPRLKPSTKSTPPVIKYDDLEKMVTYLRTNVGILHYSTLVTRIFSEGWLQLRDAENLVNEVIEHNFKGKDIVLFNFGEHVLIDFGI